MEAHFGNFHFSKEALEIDGKGYGLGHGLPEKVGAAHSSLEIGLFWASFGWYFAVCCNFFRSS